MFADLAPARCLERPEGHACVQFADRAAQILFPESGSDWSESAGPCVVFDGIDPPATQSFGLGIFAEPTAALLEPIEHIFQERATASVQRLCL